MGKQFIEENHHCQILLGVGAHLKIEFAARNSESHKQSLKTWATIFNILCQISAD
jgi:hypothetical protein